MLKPWQERVAFLKATSPMPAEEIARDKQVKKSRRAVYNALNNPLLQKRIQELTAQNMQKNAQTAVDLMPDKKALILKAIQKLNDLLDNEKTPPNVLAKVSNDILRGYGEFTERQEIEHSGSITASLIAPDRFKTEEEWEAFYERQSGSD